MPETLDPLEYVEQCHLSTIQARRQADFSAALAHNQDALAALPGTLTGTAHTEWLQRLVEERALILDTAAHRAERLSASRSNQWGRGTHAVYATGGGAPELIQPMPPQLPALMLVTEVPPPKGVDWPASLTATATEPLLGRIPPADIASKG